MVKTLRSIIHENFPLDLRVELDLISRRRDLYKAEKPQEILNALRKYNIEVTPLGPGTNRYAFKINGYVCKVATDNDGKIDNLKEFKMSKRLYPDVTKVYEVSSNGSLLIAEYISPFQSYAEMMGYSDEIREILTRLSSVYLIGDVGVTSKNYVNWGLRIGYDKPVCLDFAYVYDVSSDLFMCRECRNTMLTPNRDFTKLLCQTCGKEYLFEDIRGRIGNDLHNHEIGDLTEEGYLMYQSNVPTELNPERSNYLQKQVDEDDEDSTKKNVEIIPDNFVMKYPPEYYLNHLKRGGESEMEKFSMMDVAEKFAKSQAASFVCEAKAIDVTDNETSDVAFTGKLNNVQSIEVEAVAVTPVDVVQKPASMDTLLNIDVKSNNVENVPVEKDPIESAFANATVSSAAAVYEEDEKESEEAIKDEFINPTEYNDGDDQTADAEEIIELADDPEFIKNFQTAVSNISNDMEAWLESVKLYGLVQDGIVSNEIKKEPDFYKAVQNAIFRSLCIYFDLECLEIPAPNRANGFRREWKKVNPYSNIEMKKSGEFLAKYYYGDGIHENVSLSFKEAFYDSWPDDEWGFSFDWINYFEQRLASKFDINDESMNVIKETISNYWCSDDFDNFYYYEDYEDVNDSSVELAVEVERAAEEAIIRATAEEPAVEVTNVEDFSTYMNEPAVEDDVDNIIAFSGKINEPDDEQIEVEKDDDDNDDADLSATTISIVKNKSGNRWEIVFQETDDSGDIVNMLRFIYNTDKDYTAFNSAGRLTVVDPRNGEWDFLTHFIPDMTFTTMNPDHWIDVVYDNKSSVKCLILKPETNDTPAIMGIYTEPEIVVGTVEEEFEDFVSIFDYDENGKEIDSDNYLLIINHVISTIAGTAIDVLPSSLSIQHSSETEVAEMFAVLDPEIAGYNSINYYDEEEIAGESSDSEDDDINEAAVRALMNGIDIRNTEDDSVDDSDVTFKPIHRPKQY